MFTVLEAISRMVNCPTQLIWAAVQVNDNIHFRGSVYFKQDPTAKQHILRMGQFSSCVFNFLDFLQPTFYWV